MSELDEQSSELSRAVVDVLLRLVGGEDGLRRANAETLESKSKIIRRCVDATLSAQLTARNALAPAIHCLPDELLAHIWAKLKFEDFARANRVCRKWRTLALDSPRLWAQLVIIDTAHDSRCDCGSCDDDDDFDNFAYIQRVLPRSKTLPLSLLFHVPASMAGLEEWYTISGALRQNVHRIEELNIIADDDRVADVILGNFTQFPALRHFSLDRSSDFGVGEDPMYVESFFTQGTVNRFPVLERLVLHSDCVLGSRVVCPTLRSLSYSILRLEEVKGLLLSATRFEYLHLHLLGNFHAKEHAEDDDDAELRGKIDLIPRVRIGNIKSTSAKRAFILFAHSRRKQLEMEYAKNRLAAVAMTPQIFSECLRGSFDLRASKLRARAADVELSLSDRAGHTVLLRFPASIDDTGKFTRGAENGGAVDWSQVPALDSLITLTVDAEVWPVVMPGFPRAPNLETLTVHIRKAEDLDQLLQLGVDVSVAPNASLTISSSTPVPIRSAVLELAEQALGVQHIALRGVFLQDTL